MYSLVIFVILVEKVVVVVVVVVVIYIKLYHRIPSHLRERERER